MFLSVRDLPEMVKLQTAPESVVFLGAGASFASDFSKPTMRSFFDAEHEKYGNLARLLTDFYGTRPRTEWNLEEILGYIDLSSTRLARWDPRRVLLTDDRHARAYGECLAYVDERLGVDPDSVCERHARLFRSLAPRDSVVSLNYDLIADQALLRVDADRVGATNPKRRSRAMKPASLLAAPNLMAGFVPGFIGDEFEEGFLLKLHGSLDWITCSNEQCPAASDIFRRTGSEIPGQIAGSPCRRCGSALRTVLVPPVASKRALEHHQLQLQWSIAYRELSRARTWVVVGVSLAPSDFDVRWLLRVSAAREFDSGLVVHVVNPSRDARQQFRELLGPAGVSLVEHDGMDSFLVAK
ncbi:MAG: hypothetical protein HZA52_01855 [Planctomycetes bacterium]|nr:hypothetical protein [Planctomycetota bacterium]